MAARRWQGSERRAADRDGLYAALNEALREREALHARGSASGIKPVLVVVESERRAPSALNIIVRNLFALLYGGTYSIGNESNAIMSIQRTPDTPHIVLHKHVECAFNVSDRSTIIPHLYKLVAVHGESGSLDALRKLMCPVRCDRGSIVVVNGIPALSETDIDKHSSSTQFTHSPHSRLCRYLIEESEVVVRVHAPRMDHSQDNSVAITITTNISKVQKYV